MGHRLFGPAQAAPGEADHGDPVVVVEPPQRVAIESDLRLIAADRRPGELSAGPAIRPHRGGGRQVAEAEQGVGHPRVIVVGESGQQVVADPGAGPGLVEVAGVFAPTLTNRDEVSAHLSTRHPQERPDQRDAGAELPAWGHPGQAGQAGPADDPVQDRLGLIVARVADGDDGGPVLAGHLKEPRIAGAAGIGLEVA